MGKTFQLEILASDRPFYVGKAEHLVFPTVDDLVDGEWHYAAISEGFAEVRKDYVLILGDAIELPEEIDAKRAAEAAERAKERLLHKQSIMQYYHSQAALNRAMNRLKISKRHSHEI